MRMNWAKLAQELYVIGCEYRVAAEIGIAESKKVERTHHESVELLEEADRSLVAHMVLTSLGSAIKKALEDD